MGSRVSRAYFKTQRQKRVTKNKEEDIKQLLSLFLVFLTLLILFVDGFLFRSHVDAPGNFFNLIPASVALLFLVKKWTSPVSVLLFGNILFFVVTVIGWLLSININLFQVSFLLLSIVSCMMFSQTLLLTNWLQALITWLQFECFILGISVSRGIQEHLNNIKDNYLHQLENISIQVFFSIFAILATFLAIVGKKYLKTLVWQHQTHMSLFDQLCILPLHFTVMITAFIIKRQVGNSPLFKLVCAALAFVIVDILKLRDSTKRVWMVILSLLVVRLCVYFATEEPAHWLVQAASLLAVNLIMVDSFHKWIDAVRSGNNEPCIVVFFSFCCFYIGFVSEVGSDLWMLIGSENLFFVGAAISYLAIRLESQRRRSIFSLQALEMIS